MISKSLSAVLISGLIILAGGCAGNNREVVETQPSSLFVDIPEPAGNDGQSEWSRSEADWGIKVESARLSAAGYMVDFRFRVLDAAKAAQIFDRKVMPYMIDQTTGARFIVPNPPKVGQLRSGGNIKEGKIYFIFFANPAKYVKSGNKITVEVGDFKVQDVVVN
ncbi:MAG: hypothetical protein CEE38_16605 [Planctomycetes bacterium B3_Pla]|nr:MAG: hypothetical protein CEE38_16605 [Planctomycetes bacterium B3_Pla]